jgi:protein O-GlcNAc transferase
MNDNTFCFDHMAHIRYTEFIKIPLSEIANHIKQDNIDLLIDLIHLTSDELSLFDYSPAPTHLSYCAFPASTNHPTMHYKIMDDVTTNKINIDRHYSEQILHMKNGFHVFSPLYEIPVIQHIPHTTLFRMGCFNNPIKITKQMIQCWDTIMSRVPNAHLYLAYHYYSSLFLTQTMLQLFNDDHRSRVHFVGYQSSHKELLKLYNQMDVAIDTYPYNGTTVTCEALSMNVPVVTRAGTFPHTRIGASLLTTVQCTEMIAGTDDEYCDVVVSMTNPTKNKIVRQQIQQNLSLLTNPSDFMAGYEACLTVAATTGTGRGCT